jgi:AraC-like DNA-binding protein
MTIRDIVFVYQLKTPELVEWHSRRHSHGADEFELHYFIGGDGRFEKDGERYVITPGTIHFSPPGEHHAIQTGDIRRPLSYYAVLFAVSQHDHPSETSDDTRLHNALLHPGVEASFPRRVGARYRVLFEDLKNRYTHTQEARRRSATHLLQSLLWDTIADVQERDHPHDDSKTRADGKRSAHSAPATPDHNVHIQRALTIFENHLRDRITVGEVASRLGITQAHLTRLFTDHFGVSPLQYYRRVRMEVAASLLLNTTDSVKEIAWELGYTNPFHFSRSFRRYADMSPRAYREQYFRHNPTRYAERIIAT